MIATLLLGSALAADVVVWHAYNGAEQRALEQAAAAWGEQTGHRVIALPVPWGGFDSKVETAVPRGNGPDLVITAHGNIGKWTAMGLIEPFDAPPADLRPFTVDAMRWEGQVWGVPLAFKSPVLLYNPDQIKVPPRTTDELLDQARSLTHDGRYGLVYEAATAYYHGAWMHGFGGVALDPDGRAALDAPPSVAALDFVAQLRPLLPVRPTADRVGQLFDEGKAAMVVSGPWFVPDRKQPIAAAPLPTVSSTGQPARPYLTVDAAFVCDQAKAPAEAADFARWLAGPEGATIRRDVGGQAVSSAAVPLDSPLLKALAAQAEVAVPLPVDPDVQTVFEAQNRALRRVLRGAATPEQAGAEAQAYWASLVRPRPEPADPRPWAALLGVLALIGGAFGVRTVAQRAGDVLRHRWDYLWIGPAALTVLVLVAVPFVVGASVSLFATWHGEYVFVGVDNFTSILSSRDWPVSSPMSFFYTLGVTVLWTVTNLAAHVGLGVILALVLREPWIRLRPLFRALLILPWAVPNYITALIWKTMFDAQYGAVNVAIGALSGGGVAQIDWFGSFAAAFSANLATNTWLGFPFMMVITLGALQSIPRDLEEAAAIDGASYVQRLRHVILPMLAPALLPAIVMGSVWTFNMFNVVYLVSGGEPDGATEILVSQAYRWAFSRGNMYGYAAAYAVIIFFVLLVYSRGTNWLLSKKAA